MKVLLLGIGDSPIKSKFKSNHCDNFISRHMAGHEIITFGYNDGVDVKIDVNDDFSEVLKKLPDGWKPDVCILWEIEWSLVPKGMEAAPFPTVALLADWDYDVPFSKACMEATDFAVAISEFERNALRAIGGGKVYAFHYVGIMEEFISRSPRPMRDRKYDILYTTFIDDVMHPDRSQWILRLCSLSDKYKVLIETHLPGYKDYIELLGQAKLALSHHRYGSMSGRVLEAGGQGAVVIETGNDAGRYFLPEKEIVFAGDENLSAKLEQRLNDMTSLQETSDAIHLKVSGEFDSQKRFLAFLNFIDRHVKQSTPAKAKKDCSEYEELMRRGELYYYSHFRNSQNSFIVDANDKLLLSAVGCFEKAAAVKPTPETMTAAAISKAAHGFLYEPDRMAQEDGGEAVSLLKNIISSYPSYVMAHYNLGLIYMRVGKFTEALSHFKAVLELFGDRKSVLDTWCLHNRDFDLSNVIIRKPLNQNLLLFCKGEKNKALENIRSLYRGATLYFISLIENRMGRIYKSLDAIVEAYNLYPGSGFIVRHAAQKLALLGFKEESLKLYREAVNLLPLEVNHRIEYIKILYLYKMDGELRDELRNVLKIANTISHFREKTSELRNVMEQLSGNGKNTGCSHDPVKEIMINNYVEQLYGYLRKEPADLRVVIRIAELWNELGRVDKSLEIVEDYVRKNGETLSGEEVLVVKDVYNSIVQASADRDKFCEEKMSMLENLLRSS
ncbi:MAG: tetratricopeptide repeat protein [Nitrospirae bacterium]|nr:tetratricopeptide repeat protein [Nitrospirota bacterium]